MFEEFLGKKLCDAKKMLEKKSKYIVVLTQPPRENQSIKDDARILRVKKKDDCTIEFVVANYSY